MRFIPWDPHAFVVPREELVDEMCVAAMMYDAPFDEMLPWYDEEMLCEVTLIVGSILYTPRPYPN